MIYWFHNVSELSYHAPPLFGEERVCVALLMSVGLYICQSVGRPNGSCTLPWQLFITGILYFTC